MRNVIFISIVAMATLVSCTKSVEPEKVQGVPMTLTASFAAPTKLSYAQNGSALKSTWDASESISVVSFAADGTVLAADTFTYSGAAGSSSVDFTGTFTGEDPAYVKVIYPAIDGTALVPYTDYAGASRSILTNFGVGSKYFDNGSIEWLKQTADNDCGHFANFCVAVGAADLSAIQTNALSVTLENLATVIKFNVSFADAYKGKKLDAIKIEPFKANDEAYDRTFSTGGWQPANLSSIGLGGGWGEGDWSIYSNFNVPASGTAILYMPAYFVHTDFAAGDYWKITAEVDNVELTPVVKTFAGAVSLQNGRMYTVTASFE